MAVQCRAAAPAAVPTPQPSAAGLMALAFPGWRDAAGGHLQTVTLARLTGVSNAGYANWNTGTNQVLAEPKLVIRLDASHLTLIAGLIPAGDDGKGATPHVTPMAVAAYQFEHKNGTWLLSGSQGVFALRGFFGRATLHNVALARGRHAVGVEYGSCWQGHCGTWLALYELDKDMARDEPAVELALSGTNINATFDCGRRLRPLIKRRLEDDTREDGLAPESHDCYAIESDWHIDAGHAAPGELVVRFHGAMSRAADHAAPPVAVAQRQVLRYAGGKYRAVAGFDPVPGI